MRRSLKNSINYEFNTHVVFYGYTDEPRTVKKTKKDIIKMKEIAKAFRLTGNKTKSKYLNIKGCYICQNSILENENIVEALNKYNISFWFHESCMCIK
jgi:hypothetical protein